MTTWPIYALFAVLAVVAMVCVWPLIAMLFAVVWGGITA